MPVMVNPFEPASGYPVQAHVDRLAGLFEATFGLIEPVAGALRAGLRRAYADCGWDMRTGAARPGAVISPVTPPSPAWASARRCGCATQSPEAPAAPAPDVRRTATG